VKDPNPPDVEAAVIIEIGQRKDVERQVELKGNGKNYTVSSQMANAPKEAVQLQK